MTSNNGNEKLTELWIDPEILIKSQNVVVTFVSKKEEKDFIHVISIEAYRELEAKLKKAEAALERLTKIGPPSRPTTGLEYAEVALSDNCKIATEALKEIRG